MRKIKSQGNTISFSYRRWANSWSVVVAEEGKESWIMNMGVTDKIETQKKNNSMVRGQGEWFYIQSIKTRKIDKIHNMLSWSVGLTQFVLHQSRVKKKISADYTVYTQDIKWNK